MAWLVNRRMYASLGLNELFQIIVSEEWRHFIRFAVGILLIIIILLASEHWHFDITLVIY